MSDGARTRDILDHNQVLYQLSYTHHGLRALPGPHTRAASVYLFACGSFDRVIQSYGVRDGGTCLHG